LFFVNVLPSSQPSHLTAQRLATIFIALTIAVFGCSAVIAQDAPDAPGLPLSGLPQPGPAGATAPPAPSMPLVSPLGSNFTSPQQISISDSTPGAIIYYLVNGATPIKYTGPFTVASSQTVQAVAIAVGGGTYSVSLVNAQTYLLPAVWTQLTSLPSAFGSLGATIVNAGDGNLYAFTTSGSSPHIVTSVYVAPQSNLASWTNITSTSLSTNGTEKPQSMGTTPNGTVFLAETNFSNLSDVYYWNGSTTAPAWTKVAGWNGASSSAIYNFTNDSAGYTYFSPAWSGDIWRNTAPNSTSFTRIYTNLYSLTGAGGAGHTTSGGLYQTRIFNLNDGKGDMLWTCGEGGLSNVNLKFTSFTNYLVAPGYTGNCVGLDKSPTNILALRTADANLDMLNGIDIATRGTTIHHSSKPRTATGFPSALDTNLVGGLHWMNGTNWIFSGRDANSSSLTYLLWSQDDGNTWTDITASGAITSACKGSNLSIEAAVTTNYVIARCQNGTHFWQYGPIY
jgi:hypothetical protein